MRKPSQIHKRRVSKIDMDNIRKKPEIKLIMAIAEYITGVKGFELVEDNGPILQAAENPEPLEKELDYDTETDPVNFLLKYIPRTIEVNEKQYHIILFPGRARYDFRFCYQSIEDVDDCLYISDNSENAADLIERLKNLREQLMKDGFTYFDGISGNLIRK